MFKILDCSKVMELEWTIIHNLKSVVQNCNVPAEIIEDLEDLMTLIQIKTINLCESEH